MRFCHFVGRNDEISCADDDGRCVQLVKSKFRDIGSDIAHDGAALVAISDDDELARLANGSEQGFIIERHEGARINNFRRKGIAFL